jgi:hypothetical protein
MKHLTYTYVDAVTGVPGHVQPMRNGPAFPPLAGLTHLFALESLYPTDKPVFYGTCDDDAPTNIPGVLHVITADDAFNAHANEIKRRVADRRWRVETGGIVVADTFINTDRDTQSKLTAARIVAKEDPAYTVQWKLPGGFATLAAAQVIAMADAVRAHVQTAFDREAALVAHIEAATTHEALDAIDVGGGFA